MILAVLGLLPACTPERFFSPASPTRYASNTALYTVTDFEADLQRYKDPNTNNETKTEIRNEIIFRTISEIDRNYQKFSDYFYVKRATAATVADVVEIGLSTAGTLVGGEAIKAILHAAVTGVAATRLSFKQNFFKEQATDIILSRMDALREKHRATIYKGLKEKANVYSFYEAEADFLRFFSAGTVKAAFQDIAAESGATSVEAKERIKEAIEARFGPALLLPKDPDLKADLIKRLRKLQAAADRKKLANDVLTQYNPSLSGEEKPLDKLMQIVLGVSEIDEMNKLKMSFEAVVIIQ